jgi:hypothetical protein
MHGRRRIWIVLSAVIGALCAVSLASLDPAIAAGPPAQPILQISSAALDRPTVTNLGVQVLILGDDNYNATIIVRFRQVGSSLWNNAQPLHRVRPDVVTGLPVLEQFAGSIFDLRPATSYEIELHAQDSDGPVDQTLTLTGTTRPVPRTEPTSPTQDALLVGCGPQSVG